jgi:hypothetical protein
MKSEPLRVGIAALELPPAVERLLTDAGCLTVEDVLGLSPSRLADCGISFVELEQITDVASKLCASVIPEKDDSRASHRDEPRVLAERMFDADAVSPIKPGHDLGDRFRDTLNLKARQAGDWFAAATIALRILQSSSRGTWLVWQLCSSLIGDRSAHVPKLGDGVLPRLQKLASDTLVARGLPCELESVGFDGPSLTLTFVLVTDEQIASARQLLAAWPAGPRA